MPNWCCNCLRILGPEDEVVEFQKQAVGFQPWAPPDPGESPNILNFHSLVPIPPEVLAAGYGAAGYDWSVEHWGCKWGPCCPTVVEEWEGEVHYEFDTPGHPPIPFVEQVSRAWPTLLFVLIYEVPNSAYMGLARAQAGILENYCIDL